MDEFFYRVPLNIPHAATIARRIGYHLERVFSVHPETHAGGRVELLLLAQELEDYLEPYHMEEDNPLPDEAQQVVEESAKRARAIVDRIEALKIGDDRLGQAVRNFFECLELGEEGARISLRAGENPDSALRPA
ncbi:MAG: hypothetical protein KIS92_16405 [Planctomycetota bacterium]|nr:hypothetical protein [Planctomycetota bacterium]